MIFTKKFLYAAMLTIAIAAPASVHACSCTGPQTFEQAFTFSKHVFRGTVLEIRSAEPEHTGQVWATLHVTQIWKGAPPETTDVLTAENEAACGFTFVPGSDYLVYATNYPGEIVYTHMCTRSHETWADDPDLDLLDDVTPALQRSFGALKLLYR